MCEGEEEEANRGSSDLAGLRLRHASRTLWFLFQTLVVKINLLRASDWLELRLAEGESGAASSSRLGGATVAFQQISFCLFERAEGKSQKAKSRVLREFKQKKERTFPTPACHRWSVTALGRLPNHRALHNRGEREGDILKD